MRLVVCLSTGEELLNLAVPTTFSNRAMAKFCREFGLRNPYFVFKLEFRDDNLLPFLRMACCG